MGLGLSGLSGLSGIVPGVGAATVGVTDNLAGGTVWSRGVIYTTLVRVSEMTIRLEIDYSGGSGLLLEAGGAAWGAVIYLSNGVLVVKVGGSVFGSADAAGASPLGDSANGRLDVPISPGKTLIEISAFTALSTANLVVWKNGVIAGQTNSWVAKNESWLTGADPGGIEAIHGSIQSAAIDAGVPTTFPNAVELCKVWPGIYVGP